MAWNRPTLNDLIVRIENDITSRLTGLIPLLSRALLKVLARVSAGAFDSVYGNQEFNSEQVNVGTAAETWLRRYAFQWGVEIQDATFANGFYKFFGTNGINIPINTILVRDDNIEYITTETGNIGDLVSGEITLAIECRSSGSIGNAPSNTPLELISPIVGVDTAGSIVGDIANGEDGDTVEEIRTKVINRMQLPPMGGTVNDYRVITEEVPGVDKTFIFPNQANLAQIPGSVTAVVKGENPIVPSAAILQDVLNAMNDPDFKPITASHFTAAIVPSEMEFRIAIRPNNQSIQNNIVQNLTDMFEADAFPGQPHDTPSLQVDPILISHIRNAISTSGVTNYEILDIWKDEVNQDVDEDIEFTGFEFPILITPILFEDL